MMNKSIQISILLALALIGLAQVAYIPLALSLLFFIHMIGLALFYRKQNQVQHENFNVQTPFPQYPKLIFALLALIIIYFHYKSFLGVDAGTAVLSTFLYAKALETQSKRDFIILFNFALFVSASLFLLSQAFWMALLVLCCLVSCLMGLYRVQTVSFQTKQTVMQSLKTDSLHILKFIGLALPFFVLLFMFFPRLPPLWQIPIPNNKAVTGLSDRMSPGDIAQLSQSSALAFRVIGDMQQWPNRNALYWRAMVLDDYDGTTWKANAVNKKAKTYSKISGYREGFHYQYLASDPSQQWITALEKSIPIDQNLSLHEDWAITPQRRVQRTQPIHLQWLGNNIVDRQDDNIDQIILKNSLSYPKNIDTRAQSFAKTMYQHSQSNPELYIQNILNWYQKENFAYTLSPGKLGNNRVDEFLFQSKQGFCEHYASSFVLLMRYVGIPARVVTGYQGGEMAPDGQSWEVRQLDAHAWAEVYQQGKWHRIDPTAIIAPMRIDQGMQNLLNENSMIFGDDQFSNLRIQQFSMLRNLRVWSDYASFQWQSKVVGYDAEQQNGWMKKLGLSSSYSYGLVLILGITTLLWMYWGVSKFLLIRRMSKVEYLLFLFNRKLILADQKTESETFKQWMSRLAAQTEQPLIFEQANQQFQKIVYLGDENQEDIQQFKNLLKECANELKLHK